MMVDAMNTSYISNDTTKVKVAQCDREEEERCQLNEVLLWKKIPEVTEA